MVSEDTVKHVASDSKCQTRRNVVDELVQFVLLLHCQHDRLEVLSDFSSQLLWQVDVFHRRVGSVDHLLLGL